MKRETWRATRRRLDAKWRQRQREYETPNTLKHLLFSFKGRISRRPFWLAVMALWGLFFLFFLLLFAFIFVMKVVEDGDETLGVIGGTILGCGMLILGCGMLIFFTWSALAITIKRLHDCDLSGWWCVWLFVLWFALSVLGKHYFHVDQSDIAARQIARDAVSGISCLIVHLITLIVLGVHAGTTGENQFGRSPIRADKAENAGDE